MLLMDQQCRNCTKPFRPHGLRQQVFMACDKCQAKVDRAIRKLGWKPDHSELYDAGIDEETGRHKDAGLLRLPGKGKKFKNLWKLIEEE